MKRQKAMHFFPVAGRRVLLPGTRTPLPLRGVVVASSDPNAAFWLRRQREGDVTRLSRASGIAPASTAVQPPAEGGSQEHPQ